MLADMLRNRTPSITASPSIRADVLRIGFRRDRGVRKAEDDVVAQLPVPRDDDEVRIPGAEDRVGETASPSPSPLNMSSRFSQRIEW